MWRAEGTASNSSLRRTTSRKIGVEIHILNPWFLFEMRSRGQHLERGGFFPEQLGPKYHVSPRQLHTNVQVYRNQHNTNNYVLMFTHN